MEKPDYPSIVLFEAAEMPEHTHSFVVADDIWFLEKHWLNRRIDGLSPPQMRRVDEAIHAALDLSY